MAKFKRGDNIQAKHKHNNIPAGTKGVVTGVYHGPYVAVSYPGFGSGPFYSPVPHIDNDPDHDGDNDATPAPAPAAASAWEKLMDMLKP